MTIPQQFEPASVGPGEAYTPGEITRWLTRVELAIGGLRNDVVIRAVYEAERREMERDIADLKVGAEKDRAAALLRHERLVNRAWWLVAGLAGLALTVVGLVLTVVGLFLKAGGS